MAVLQFANGLELEIDGQEMVEVSRGGCSMQLSPANLRPGDVMVIHGVTSGDGTLGSTKCLQSDSSVNV